MLKEKVYWHDTVKMPSGHEASKLPQKVDVAVVGGGYTGLSAALTLAKRGVSVAVFDAETIGWGASSRNGGMVLTGLKIPMQTAIKRYGRDFARRLFQCSLDSIATVEKLCKEEAIDCGFARTGHLLAANKPKHYELLAKEAEFMAKEFEHAVRLVPRGEHRDEIGSDLYHSALVDEVSAGVNPAQYVTGLAGAAEKAGATLHARARSTSWNVGRSGFLSKRSADRFKLKTSLWPRTGTPVLPPPGYAARSCQLGRTSSPPNRCTINWPASSARITG